MAMHLKLPHNWTPRAYQKPLWQHMTHDFPGLRGIGVWHRRAGKDLLGINLACVKAVQKPALYWHILPTYKQGRKVVWNGRTSEGVRFLDHFPKVIVDRVLENEMRVYLKNGSIYEVVGTDDVDKLMGANPHGCIFSEFAIQDPKAWQLIEPILIENGGWALFISTVRGKNHFYDLYKTNRDNQDWFTEVLTVRETKREDGSPVVSEADLEKVRAGGTPEAIIKQEMMCDWEAALEGAIYGKLMDAATEAKRITRVPWEPRHEVHTYWDLGFGDETCIVFAQHFGGMETRIIDYHEASGAAMPELVRHVREKEYVYGNHWAPWDVEMRNLAGHGQTLLETAKQLGLRFRVVPKHHVRDRIGMGRSIFPQLWIDAKKCDRLVEALRSYQYEWDDKRQAPRDTPLHNWASHPADAFGSMAWAMKMNRKPGPQPDKAADYAPPWQ